MVLRGDGIDTGVLTEDGPAEEKFKNGFFCAANDVGVLKETREACRNGF